MTFVGVITNYHKVETASRLKKVYTTVGNVLPRVVYEYGDLNNWDWANTEKIMKDYVSPNLVSAKVYPSDCSYGSCFCDAQKRFTYSYKWPGGQGITSPLPYNVASIEFLDGACINLSRDVYAINTNTFYLWIDLNGAERKPNKIAKDVFVFKIDNKGKLQPYTAYGCEDGLNYQPSATGLACGSRILDDGWKINYHWAF